MKHDYNLNDIVEMKKPHPCKKSPYFQIIRVGADIKIECQGCGAIIMMTRSKFDRRLKKVVEKKEER